MGSRVALVTGASRGLGASIARRLAADGFAVAVNYHSGADRAAELVGEITAAGGRATAVGADVTDPDDVDRLVSHVEGELGPLDVVVFNATGPQPHVAVDEVDWRAMLDQLDFFVKSPVLLAGRVLPGMKRRRHGRLIHIGSEVVDAVPSRSAPYVTAKTAQLGLARSWARELGEWDITVNTVAPGWVPVERHAGATEQSLDAYRATVALGRMGVPADVASAVAYLASDEAAFLTGVCLHVNGGRTLA